MMYSKNLQTEIAKSLHEEVLSLSMVEGRIAPDSDSYRTGNVIEKYAKETNLSLYTLLAAYQNPSGLRPFQNTVSKQRMLCAVTTTTVYLLAFDEEATIYSRFRILADFDRHTAKIVDQHTTTKLGKMTLELKDKNVHAKIESNLFSANYNPEMVKMLRQNYIYA